AVRRRRRSTKKLSLPFRQNIGPIATSGVGTGKKTVNAGEPRRGRLFAFATVRGLHREQAGTGRQDGNGGTLGFLDRPGWYFHRCHRPCPGRRGARRQAPVREPRSLCRRGGGRNP